MLASRSTEARMSSMSMVARLGCVLWDWGETIAVTMAVGFGGGGGWIKSGAEIERNVCVPEAITV